MAISSCISLTLFLSVHLHCTQVIRDKPYPSSLWWKMDSPLQHSWDTSVPGSFPCFLETVVKMEGKAEQTKTRQRAHILVFWIWLCVYMYVCGCVGMSLYKELHNIQYYIQYITLFLPTINNFRYTMDDLPACHESESCQHETTEFDFDGDHEILHKREEPCKNQVTFHFGNGLWWFNLHRDIMAFSSLRFCLNVTNKLHHLNSQINIFLPLVTAV